MVPRGAFGVVRRRLGRRGASTFSSSAVPESGGPLRPVRVVGGRDAPVRAARPWSAPPPDAHRRPAGVRRCVRLLLLGDEPHGLQARGVVLDRGRHCALDGCGTGHGATAGRHRLDFTTAARSIPCFQDR